MCSPLGFALMFGFPSEGNIKKENNNDEKNQIIAGTNWLTGKRG
ncbi:hypothetical protein XBJ2_130105 [Xenorhabdus bovienii str. Jollieti]|uniref:Uncharacterized protein n=2 Tax=Xenorhabdus bovienii TaxID=40576 RepID=A0A077QE12_XENBV|nr:hypothetical protein XBJ1_0415 [Xenorhabdus bovienii SS-2004]CDH27431.1 hypothetical protein XBJ2_130105 [Xenorhabdus bovienii str. Jollieti]CDH31654.1 hypothetical protein XBI1_1570128 [Xenorhabdus bovienii str. Intermedium]